MRRPVIFDILYSGVPSKFTYPALQPTNGTNEELSDNNNKDSLANHNVYSGHEKWEKQITFRHRYEQFFLSSV